MKGNKYNLILKLFLVLLYVLPHASISCAQSEWEKQSGKVIIHEINNRTVFHELEKEKDNNGKAWKMHLMDPAPSSGSDGVKLADVNGDGFPDLVTGFEEGGVSRIYINPGPDRATQYWDYVELPSPDVEDAVLVDLNNNGIMDLVTASEGSTNQIMFHWAPENPDDYLDGSEWRTEVLPVTDDLSAWMFVVPADMDGENGMDLIVGSKRKREDQGNDKAVVGWLRCPEDPKNIGE